MSTASKLLGYLGTPVLGDLVAAIGDEELKRLWAALLTRLMLLRDGSR